MQYLQIMDRGALSMVFSPVEEKAALGVPPPAATGGAMKKPPSNGSSAGAGSPPVGGRASTIAFMGELSETLEARPPPATSGDSANDAVFAALDAEIAALEPVSPAGQDLHALVPSPP